MRIGVRVEPPRPRAGQDFSVHLSVLNDSDRVVHGVFIGTSGPWDRYTILTVAPAGRVGRDATGWYIVSPADIPPGSTITLEVRARADDPSDEQLTFAVREARPGELTP